MTRIALTAAALVALLGAPALAQSHQTVAIQHFNADADSVDDIRRVRDTGADVVISTRNAPAAAEAYARFNADADSPADLRGTTGQVAGYAGTPAHGAEIFADLRAAAQEDE